MSEEIQHVSDTALMTAACRARETERPDGLVRDPFAERLAGERGLAIARGLPGFEVMCFGVGIRSRFLDELVMHAVAAHGIQTVAVVGSGLDSRPWRLDLPADLRWIEVDFPAILDYKAAMMEGEQPRCRLERIAADVNDAAQRQAVFAAIGSAPALMITEGLLMYLPAGTVEALACEVASASGVRHWLADVTSPTVARNIRMDTYESIQRMRAEDHLDGLQILDTFQRNGWQSIMRRSYITDAWAAASERIKAMAANRATSSQIKTPPLDDPSGVHLLAHGK